MPVPLTKKLDLQQGKASIGAACDQIGGFMDDAVMKQDMAHKRPWLLISLFFGISYPLIGTLPLPGIILLLWKMTCVGSLVIFALCKHHSGEFAMLAAALALWALGDGLIEFEMLWGGIAFALGHMVAIVLFLRHRRVKPAFSQKLLAITVLLLAPVIAYFLPSDRGQGLQVAAYAVFVAAMAACAWNSNFPRYRVGIGAMAFVMSDLLIFAREGVLAQASWVSLAIWILYYGGVLMIATGVVTTLVKRGHFVDE
jgi:uncharacterized membrane protein YhhN